MTSTPKSVILAVVVILGVFALAALGAVTYLIADGQSAATVAILSTPMGLALGGIIGLLASTRTTPELPPGGTLTTGTTTISAPEIEAGGA